MDAVASGIEKRRAKRMPEVMPTEIAYSGDTAGALKCTLDLGELFSCPRVALPQKSKMAIGSGQYRNAVASRY